MHFVTQLLAVKVQTNNLRENLAQQHESKPNHFFNLILSELLTFMNLLSLNHFILKNCILSQFGSFLFVVH